MTGTDTMRESSKYKNETHFSTFSLSLYKCHIPSSSIPITITMKFLAVIAILVADVFLCVKEREVSFTFWADKDK